MKANTEIVVPIVTRGKVSQDIKKKAPKEQPKPRVKDPRSKCWVIRFLNKDTKQSLNREVTGSYEYAESMRDKIIDSKRFTKKHYQGISRLYHSHNSKYSK